MIIRCLVAAASVAIAALAQAVLSSGLDSDAFACGVSHSDEFKKISSKLAMEEAEDKFLDQKRSATEINVSVYVHVVASSQNATDGYLSDDAVQNQLQVLNSDYEQAGITFNLKAIDKTINATWANGVDLDYMWYTLHNGSYGDLNIWFIPVFAKYYGLCTLPALAEDLGLAQYQDGCTIRSDTAPGGSLTNYNLGKTLTHEVGHWFGLLHTFEGGCEDPGDYVDDTPAQASATIGCPVERDSCPDKPGLDPIHNFMDYSYDTCLKEFTPGQIVRMQKVWAAYRAPPSSKSHGAKARTYCTSKPL
ncbi:hypothetical protein V8C35DRAFT_276748 [Trichoderma chlorosporum]